jgi:hypothetical protein
VARGSRPELRVGAVGLEQGSGETGFRTVRASKDDPQYRVRSDKSGKDAVHRPSALEDEP